MVYLLIFHDRTGRYMADFSFSISSAATYHNNTIRAYRGWRLAKVITYKNVEEFRRNIDTSMCLMGIPNRY